MDSSRCAATRASGTLSGAVATRSSSVSLVRFIRRTPTSDAGVGTCVRPTWSSSMTTRSHRAAGARARPARGGRCVARSSEHHFPEQRGLHDEVGALGIDVAEDVVGGLLFVCAHEALAYVARALREVAAL